MYRLPPLPLSQGFPFYWGAEMFMLWNRKARSFVYRNSTNKINITEHKNQYMNSHRGETVQELKSPLP